MAIKTFTGGEVLTAANTNTYLANAGLVYVAGASFSGAVSFDVTGFTSDYLFFELKMSIAAVGATGITGVIYSGATARTSYYGSTFFSSYLGTSGVQDTRNGAANFYLGDVTASVAGFYTCSIRGVGNGQFATTIQGYDSNNSRSLTGGYSNYAATNSFDKIRFTGGSNLNGSWSLMGVRKP